MPSTQTTTWGNENWTLFNKGPRVYFVHFQISIDGKQIRYGSTIYKNTGDDVSFDNHFQTAKQRFLRFPVTADISEKILNLMDANKTRRSKMIFFENKKFQNFLIQTFVKHGVRFRQGKDSYTSLRKKILDNRQAILSKKRRLMINNTEAEIRRSEKVRQMMIKGFNPNEKGFQKKDYPLGKPGEINPKLTMNMVIWEEGDRTYHVDIQHNPSTNEARYGACVFKANSLEECQKYDKETHIDTAVDRFENFPVTCYLPLTYTNGKQTRTRSQRSGEFPINKENLQILKKALCIFGARKRMQQDNFLKKVELNNKKDSEIKKINREQQKLDFDFSSYRKTIQNKKKATFPDSPPIILNRRKKIPSPVSSPRTQDVAEVFYQKIESKYGKVKTNKGLKNKQVKIQKRKNQEEYRKQQIEKERLSSEKTKEKVNRRKMTVI